MYSKISFKSLKLSLGVTWSHFSFTIITYGNRLLRNKRISRKTRWMNTTIILVRCDSKLVLHNKTGLRERVKNIIQVLWHCIWIFDSQRSAQIILFSALNWLIATHESEKQTRTKTHTECFCCVGYYHSNSIT